MMRKIQNTFIEFFQQFYSKLSDFLWLKKKNQVNVDELQLLDVVEEKEEDLRLHYNNEKELIFMKKFGKTATNETFNNTIEYNVVSKKYAYTETDPLHLGTVVPEETFEKLSKKVIAPSLLQVYPSEYAQDSILFRLSAICSYFFVVFAFFFGELTLGFNFFYFILLGLCYLGVVVICSHISYNLSILVKKGGNLLLQIIWYFSGTFFNPNISKYIFIIENIKKNLIFKIFKTVCLLIFSFFCFFIILKLYVLLTFYINLLEYLETFLLRSLKHIDFCNSLITRGNPKLEKLSTSAYSSGDYWHLYRQFREHQLLVGTHSSKNMLLPGALIHEAIASSSKATPYSTLWEHHEIRKKIRPLAELVWYTKYSGSPKSWCLDIIGRPDVWLVPANRSVPKNSILVNTHFPRIFGPFGNDISTFMFSERGLTYRFSDGHAAARMDPTFLMGRILNGSFFYDTFTQFNYKFLNTELLNIKKKFDFFLRVIPNILIYFETQLDFLSVFDFLFNSFKTKKMFDDQSLTLFFNRLETNDSFQSMRLGRFFNNYGSVLVGRYEKTNFANLELFSKLKKTFGWFDYNSLLQDPMYFFNLSFNNLRMLSCDNKVLIEDKFKLSPGFLNQVLKHRSFVYNFICRFSDDYSLFLLKLKETSNYMITVMTSLSKLMLPNDFYRSSNSKFCYVALNTHWENLFFGDPERHAKLPVGFKYRTKETNVNGYKIWRCLPSSSYINPRLVRAKKFYNYVLFNEPRLWAGDYQFFHFKKSCHHIGTEIFKYPMNPNDQITYILDKVPDYYKLLKSTYSTETKWGSKWTWFTGMPVMSPLFTDVRLPNLAGINVVNPDAVDKFLYKFAKKLRVNRFFVDKSFFSVHWEKPGPRHRHPAYDPYDRHFFTIHKRPRFMPSWHSWNTIPSNRSVVAQFPLQGPFNYETNMAFMNCRDNNFFYFNPTEYGMFFSEVTSDGSYDATVQKNQLWRYFPAGMDYSELDNTYNSFNVLGRPFGRLVFLRNPNFGESLASNFFTCGVKKLDSCKFENKIFKLLEKKNIEIPFMLKKKKLFLQKGQYNNYLSVLRDFKFRKYYNFEPLITILNFTQFFNLAIVKLNLDENQIVNNSTISNIVKIFERNEQLSTLFSLYKYKTSFFMIKQPFIDDHFLSGINNGMFFKNDYTNDTLTSEFFTKGYMFKRKRVLSSFSCPAEYAKSSYLEKFTYALLPKRYMFPLRGLDYVDQYYNYRTKFDINSFMSKERTKCILMDINIRNTWRGPKYVRTFKQRLSPSYYEEGQFKSFLSMYRDLTSFTTLFTPLSSARAMFLRLVHWLEFYIFLKTKKCHLPQGKPRIVEASDVANFLHRKAAHMDMEVLAVHRYAPRYWRYPAYVYGKAQWDLYNQRKEAALPQRAVHDTNMLIDRCYSWYHKRVYSIKHVTLQNGLNWGQEMFDFKVPGPSRRKFEYKIGYPFFIMGEIPLSHACRLMRASINQNVSVSGGSLINFITEKIPVHPKSEYFEETGQKFFYNKISKLIYGLSNKYAFGLADKFHRILYFELPNVKSKTPMYVPRNQLSLKKLMEANVSTTSALCGKLFPIYIKLFKNQPAIVHMDCKFGVPYLWIRDFAFNLINNGSHKKHLQQILGLELDFKLKLFLPIKQSGILPSDVEHLLLATYCWEEVLKKIEEKDFTYEFESLFFENGMLKDQNGIGKVLQNLKSISDKTTLKYCFEIPELSVYFSENFGLRISGLKKEDIAYFTYKTEPKFSEVFASEKVQNYLKEQKELVEAFVNSRE